VRSVLRDRQAAFLRSLLAIGLSSAVGPGEINPGGAERGSGTDLKLFGFIPDSMFTFIPDHCSE
jgi:hypothetical protein